MFSSQAEATPAFAVQTSQPCEACHVGAYGPQLTPYGRDFKLYGYTADDGKKHFPPVAFMERTTFTHTKDSQSAPPEHGYGTNDNFSIGEASLFYTGKVTDNIGVYLEPISYEGASRNTGWANSEVRVVHEGKLFHKDYIAGITVNNAPTVSDLWNATPQWGWPYDAVELAPTPTAGTLLGDGTAGFQVAGAGAYVMFNNWVYAEFELYHGLSAGTRNFVGAIPVTGTDTYEGVMPYWRLALQHDFDHHRQYLEVGALGMMANVNPGGDASAGVGDKKTDVGFDANYQWLGKENIISAHALYMHENTDLHASEVLAGTNSSDQLQEFKANVSYSYKNTWIPTIGYFRTWGSDDAAYWQTSTGSASPNSAGYTAELAYVPWGKEDSIIQGANARFELQYTGYTQFDGVSTHAGANNTIFLNLGIFFDPVPYLNGDYDKKGSN
ncbi:MAG TPA: hypothetical protein VFT64_08780 [Rickettsiales bacterium]|nr:hypothetical protein [Rickettsiales bacterium]